MDARSLLLANHAAIHSRSVAPAEGLNLPDITVNLTDGLLTTSPPGLNSIAWLIRHMARTEDVAVNTVLRSTGTVLDREDWGSRLGIDATHIGTGDTADDLARFNREIDVGALKAYRDAVGRETREWICSVDLATLDASFAGGELGRSAGAFRENAAWVGHFWEGKTGSWYVSWLGVGHNYFHLGEAGVISRALGVPGA